VGSHLRLERTNAAKMLRLISKTESDGGRLRWIDGLIDDRGLIEVLSESDELCFPR